MIVYLKLSRTDASKDALELTSHFKTTFSISDNVQVHFLGAWYVYDSLYMLELKLNRDTVSSIGVFRDMPLPLTHATDHLCFFRHALALDECRVKFIPEYLDPSEQPTEESGHMPSEEKSSGKDGQSKGKSLGKTSQSSGQAKSLHNSDPGSNEGKTGGNEQKTSNAETKYRKNRVKEVWFAGSHSDM